MVNEGTYGPGEHTLDVSNEDEIYIEASGAGGQGGDHGIHTDDGTVDQGGGDGGDGAYSDGVVNVSSLNQVTLRVANNPPNSADYDGGLGGSGQEYSNPPIKGGDGGDGAGSTVLIAGGERQVVVGGGGGGGGGTAYDSGSSAPGGGGGGGSQCGDGGASGALGADNGADGNGCSVTGDTTGGNGGDGGGSDDLESGYPGTDGTVYSTGSLFSAETTTTGGANNGGAGAPSQTLGSPGSGGSGSIYVEIEKVAPSEPRNLTVTTVDNDSLSLDWDEPTSGDDPEEYNVYRSTSSGVSTSDTLVDTISYPTSSYTDNGLLEGETYYYAVNAENGTRTGGVSALSNEDSATTVLRTPSNLDSTLDESTNEVTLTWQNNDTSTDGGIDVQRSSDGGSTWTEIATGLAYDATTYTDTNTTTGEQYNYRVERFTPDASSLSNETITSIRDRIGTTKLNVGGTEYAVPVYDIGSVTDSSIRLDKGSSNAALDLVDPSGNPIRITKGGQIYGVRTE